MLITVVGTGRAGRTLARRLRELGHDVTVATRDPEATFVPTVGLRRPGARTRLANLVVAGAWTDTGWPATMESAVRSGRSAAAALIEALEPAAPAHDRGVPAAPEMAHAV